MNRKTAVTLTLRVEIDTEAWEEAYGTVSLETAIMAQQDVIDAVHQTFVDTKWIEFASNVFTTDVETVTTLAEGTPVVPLWECEAQGRCAPHPEGPDGKPRPYVAQPQVVTEYRPTWRSA